MRCANHALRLNAEHRLRSARGVMPLLAIGPAANIVTLLDASRPEIASLLVDAASTRGSRMTVVVTSTGARWHAWPVQAWSGWS